jgi:uncharacterized RDD family membrane protein YckC
MLAFSIDVVILALPLFLAQLAAEWYLEAHPEVGTQFLNLFLRALDGSPGDKLAVIGGLVALLVLLLLPYDLYFIFMEWKHGATLGKRWLGLRVQGRNGGPLSFRQSWLRQLFRHIDSILILPGLIGMASRHRARLGDRVAKTKVVRIRS